jgi:aspartyl-tRNA(Asn)/glutamyl-tRNA(Gln) amidotransferase subunit B
MMGELARVLKDAGRDIAHSPVSAVQLAELLQLVGAGTISNAVAKRVFETMLASGRPAGEIVEEQGLRQIDDEARLDALIASVVNQHPDAVAQYRAGKMATFGFLVGQVMKAAGGTANPKRVNELLRREIDRS